MKLDLLSITARFKTRQKLLEWQNILNSISDYKYSKLNC